jgi:hypothetical protein
MPPATVLKPEIIEAFAHLQSDSRNADNFVRGLLDGDRGELALAADCEFDDIEIAEAGDKPEDFNQATGGDPDLVHRAGAARGGGKLFT